MQRKHIVIMGCAALVAVAMAWIAWNNRRGTFSHANYERIHAGMKLTEVERLLGSPGGQTPEEELPMVVDWSVPINDPTRSKPVVSGEQYFRWRGEVNGAQIIISLRDGVVAEKVVLGAEPLNGAWRGRKWRLYLDLPPVDVQLLECAQ